MVDASDKKAKRRIYGALRFTMEMSAFVAMIAFVIALSELPAMFVVAVSPVPIFVCGAACLIFIAAWFVSAWV